MASGSILILVFILTLANYFTDGSVCKCVCTSEQNGQSGLMESSEPEFRIGNEQAAAELIKYALKLWSPFIKKAVEKITEGVFGSGRARRSCDFAVINSASVDFDLDYGNTDCSNGGWTGDMLPPDILEANTSVVFGGETVGGIPGAFEGVWCAATYVGKKGERVYMVMNTPQFGNNVAYLDAKGVQASYIVAAGFSNVARFTLKNFNT